MAKQAANIVEKMVKTVAAIDIGANSLRMIVAQVLPDGTVEQVEHLRRALRLGQDAFRRGRISRETMTSAVSILRDYRRLLDFYNVSLVRAVATSAVREAANSDAFLDRVLIATGLDIEVIDTSEESRLNVQAVKQAAGRALGPKSPVTLIVEVGGGSTLLTVLEGGEIAVSQSLNLGSVRMPESLGITDELPVRSADILDHHIDNVVSAVQPSMPLRKIKRLIAVGGDARFAATQVGKKTKHASLISVSPDDLAKLARRCARSTPEELIKKHHMPMADAETLIPALMVYRVLLKQSGAAEMLVSEVSMRHGLVQDLTRIVTGQEDESLYRNVLHSAEAVAEKYKVNLRHARHVAKLAVQLYDELQAEHGLDSRHRLLLQVAALLHETGGFVSSRAHHKHSYYLISNSEIFGLTREEIEMVAQVARYHRRSGPKQAHFPFQRMPRDKRIAITKLAAILRVADALDRAHHQQIKSLHVEREGDELILYIPGVSDLTLERRALAGKGDLFTDIFCLQLRLEETRLPMRAPERAGIDERG